MNMSYSYQKLIYNKIEKIKLTLYSYLSHLNLQKMFLNLFFDFFALVPSVKILKYLYLRLFSSPN